MTSRSIQFGVFMPQITGDWREIEARAQCAERAGFDSVWLMDHLAPPGIPDRDCFEAWTTATAIAMATTRVRIGHLVLCNNFRHPALLAKMAATLDRISNGRLDLGLGWGSVPAELGTYGIGEEAPAIRSARLSEAIEVIRLLFTGERVDYQGRFYQLKGAIARPTPVQNPLPIHIGGAGPKLTLPIVREHADWWNCVAAGTERLAELRSQIGKARISMQHPIGLVTSEAEREKVRAACDKRFAGWGGVVCGTAPEIAASLAAEVKLGAELFICVFSDGGRPETLERFAREVIPAVRAAA
jgi:alkanesulfonate monooxygenase SsuD/methylene tetrahydromethanopterin reductase-like flavin-dependent oxidoreductase (luciferase family)